MWQFLLQTGAILPRNNCKQTGASTRKHLREVLHLLTKPLGERKTAYCILNGLLGKRSQAAWLLNTLPVNQVLSGKWLIKQCTGVCVCVHCLRKLQNQAKM